MQGNFDEAVEYYRRATKLDPAMRSGYLILGKALAHLGRWLEAINAYRTAYQMGVRTEELYLGLADSETTIGDRKAARATLEEAARLYPWSKTIHAKLSALDP